jgi:tRNA-splicing ligase RtcB
MVAVMVHSGSVGLGGMVGQYFMDLARKLHPRIKAMPRHGYHPIPTAGPLADKGEAYLSAMGLAANFAVVNRLMLGALALRCLSDAAGRSVNGSLVYDAPHNLIWSHGHDHLHRKGACPAGSEPEDPLFPDGHPVIVPGSMGDASYVLKGQGSLASLCSAPHGAGRLAARGEGRKGDVGELARIRVVTRIDPARVRREIAAEHMRTLMEEAPSQYKSVAPVVETVAEAGIAAPVARLRPLLTIKG